MIVPILLGCIAGYFVNYLADVLPFTRRFSQPACLQCDAPYPWKDYFSFHSCQNGHSRKARPWIVMAAMLAASIYTWINPPSKIGYLLGIILITYFGVVSVIDMEHRLILHPTSIFGALLGLIVGTVAHGIKDTLWGGAGGFYYFGVLFTRMRTKRMLAQGKEADDEEALGTGDVILVAILGFILGWPLIWFGLLFGILLGGFFSLLLILWLLVTRKYGRNALMLFIPYGPYFIASAFMIIYFPKFIRMLVPV
jgi:prepilin signal peptidase PulO-like enzyme (type II secretory pathway)